MKIANIAELKTRKGTDGFNATVLGYYTLGDGGGGEFYWDNTSTITDNGGTVIQVTSVTTGRWIRNNSNIIDVRCFGAKGDFNSITGIGTNDRASIQKAFDYATLYGNYTIIFPKGNYYLGNAIGTYTGNVQLLIGSTTPNTANNITVLGENATLYGGYEGRLIGIFGANRVKIKDLKIIGYTGGTLSTNRERDALITINYNSKFVEIDNCYLTNSLGDCIYAGGSLVSGGENGYETKDLTVRNCILKERYGDGVPSYLSGTKSRHSISIIDAIGVNINNNIFYGGIDLEPNLNGQHSVNISISNNKFLAGNVTPQSIIGTSYWYDEPINNSGGTVIEGSVIFTGTAGSPIVTGNTVKNNVFDDGTINSQNVYKFDLIESNVFQKGQIQLGYVSGSNFTQAISVKNNIAVANRTGESCFIKLTGNIYYCVISGNIGYTGFTDLINNNGTSTGDGGRNVYQNNVLSTGTNVINSTFLSSLTSSSVVSGNIKTGTSSRNVSEFDKTKINEIYSPLITISGATGANTFNYQTYGGNIWYITIPVNTIGTITDITNENGDGQVITIKSGSSGTGNLTITYNSSTIRTSTGTDLVLTSGQFATFINRSGIWFEVSNSSTVLNKLNTASPAFTGNMTGTGNISLTSAGNKLNIATGTNASVGIATLASGTITISTTAVTANSIILITAQQTGNLIGVLRVSAKTTGTSFVISSSVSTDTAVVGWMIIN